jgi:hypothetical protein
VSTRGGTEADDRPEFELLRLFSRTTLEGEREAQARALLGDDLEWGYLGAIAGYHGVQPLLYYHLRRLAPELLAVEPLDRLRAVVGARSAHGLVLVHELGRLAEVFERGGLPVLAMKGPVLAQSIYGGIALRPFVDLDLVIDRARFDEANRILVGEGYESRELTPFQKRSYLFIHGQFTFWRRMASVGSALAVIDLHTAIMPPGYSYTEGFDDLLRRSGTMKFGASETRVLEAVDLLEVLCYHGFKNRWDRLKYVADVAELLRATPGLNWDAVYARARAMRSSRVLWLGLSLAERVLDAPMPERVSRDVHADRYVTTLSDEIVGRLPQQAHMKVEPYLDRVRLNILAQDSLLGRLRYGAYATARRISELYIPEGG